jgi:hypothetical protein
MSCFVLKFVYLSYAKMEFSVQMLHVFLVRRPNSKKNEERFYKAREDAFVV